MPKNFRFLTFFCESSESPIKICIPPRKTYINGMENLSFLFDICGSTKFSELHWMHQPYTDTNTRMIHCGSDSGFALVSFNCQNPYKIEAPLINSQRTLCRDRNLFHWKNPRIINFPCHDYRLCRVEYRNIQFCVVEYLIKWSCREHLKLAAFPVYQVDGRIR